MSFKIAIDGPASAGKSTMAKMLAKELGYIYIDTGAMYRAIGLYLLDNNIDYNNEEKIKSVLDNICIDIKYENDVQNIYLNDKNVTGKIRTQEVSNAASVSSQFKPVREKLLNLQRDLSNRFSCVMDGRDIASRVLPDANVKIFMTASVECRAKRRFIEDTEKGIVTTYEDTLKELTERDYRDTHRENDPLKMMDDAILIDTTTMTMDEVIDKLLSIVTGDSK